MSGGFSGVGGYAVILTPEGASLYGSGNASFEALVTAATGKIDVEETTQEILDILQQQYEEQIEIENNIRAAYNNESIENIIKSLRGETSKTMSVPEALQSLEEKIPVWQQKDQEYKDAVAQIRKDSEHYYQVYNTLVDGLVALANQLTNMDEKALRTGPGIIETLINKWGKSTNQLEQEAAKMAQSLAKLDLDNESFIKDMNSTFDKIRETINKEGIAYSYDPTSNATELKNPELTKAIQELLAFQEKIRGDIDKKSKRSKKKRQELLAMWNNVKFANWNAKNSKLGQALNQKGKDDPITILNSLRQKVYDVAKRQLEENTGRKATDKEQQKLRASVTKIQTKAIDELSEQTEDYAVRQLVSLVFGEQTQIGPLKGLLAEQFKTAAAKSYIQDIDNSVQQAYKQAIGAVWEEIITNLWLTGKDTRNVKMLKPSTDNLEQIVQSDDDLRIGTDINAFDNENKRYGTQNRLHRINDSVDKYQKNKNKKELTASGRELRKWISTIGGRKNLQTSLDNYFDENIIDLPSIQKQFDKVDSVQAATVGKNPYYIAFSEKQRTTGGMTGSIGLMGDDISVFNNMNASGTNLYSSLDLISQNGADSSIPTAQIMFAMLNQSTASIYHNSSSNVQEKIKNYIKMQLAAKVLDLAFNRVNFFFNQQQKGIDMNHKNTLFVMNVNNLYVSSTAILRGLIEKFQNYQDIIADIVYVNVEFDTAHQAYPLWMAAIASQGSGDANQAARWGFVANQVAANTKLNVSLSIANLMQLFDF